MDADVGSCVHENVRQWTESIAAIECIHNKFWKKNQKKNIMNEKNEPNYCSRCKSNSSQEFDALMAHPLEKYSVLLSANSFRTTISNE